MRTLWKLTKEAARYKGLYVIAILSTLSLTLVNLTAPKVLSAMTGLVEKGVDEAALKSILLLAWILLGLYLLRVLFR
ncbi:MAG: ABC transporter ATP-binding protein, partial [Lachnospiraceae bacterium]|nr:ABC transporter ATP-binding protein [Lachnospiraceae bacterium]